MGIQRRGRSPIERELGANLIAQVEPVAEFLAFSGRQKSLVGLTAGRRVGVVTEGPLLGLAGRLCEFIVVVIELVGGGRRGRRQSTQLDHQIGASESVSFYFMSRSGVFRRNKRDC